MASLRRFLSRACAVVAAALALHVPAQAAYVSGGRVYDDSGHALQLKGVNWFGFETPDHAPHGLWARKLDDMLDQMQSLGFNAVRLPFCPATVHGAPVTSVDYVLNPDLRGQDSQQLLDTVVARLERRGMYFLLDHHRPDCGQISELWYTGSYTEAQWLADLQFVAARYQGNAHFLGMDLKNEPHGAATWGAGVASTDWNAAAERAGAAVLAKAPRALVFVEGITQNNFCTASSAGTWWGGNLGPQRCAPLKLPAEHLVLSPHVYGPDVAGQDYFNAAGFPANMPAIWDANFGALAAAGQAVVVGETGGKYGTGDPRDKTFQDALFAYLAQRGMFDLFYWCWNPNSGDTGGILADDWTTVRADKMALLRKYWAAGAGSGSGGSVPAIVLGASTLRVPEGGSASVAVSLSARPTATVTVKIGKAAGGDADLTAAASQLVFTSANWATPQPLVIRAAQDADTTAGSASFQLTAASVTGATLAAIEIDDDVPPAADCALAFDTSNAWNNGEVLSLEVRNLSTTTPVANWSVTWTSSADVTVGSAWNATIASAGRRLAASPAAWNTTIAPGASVTLGAVLGFTGAKALPVGASLAGHACTVTVR